MGIKMKIKNSYRILAIILIFPLLNVALSFKSFGFMLDPVFDRDIQIDKISVSGYTVRSSLAYDYISNEFKKRSFINDLIYFNDNGYPTEKYSTAKMGKF